MKKIIILILLFFNTAPHLLKAQEAASTLTQLTTDLLQGDAKTNFNWKNINPPIQQNNTTNNTMARNAFCWFFCKVLGWKRWCSDDITGTGGNDAVFGGKCPGSGSGSTDIKTPIIITVTSWPHIKPDDWMPNNPNLPTDQGGGGTIDPNDPKGTPPTDPDKDPKGPDKPNDKLDEEDKLEVLQPNEDSTIVIYDTLPCSDSITKAIGKRLDKDLLDVRNKTSNVDSIYRYGINADSAVAVELGMVAGRNPVNQQITYSGIISQSDPVGVKLPFTTDYTTDFDFHNHFARGYKFPNIVDVYSILIKTSYKVDTTKAASYVFCYDSTVFAFTPTAFDSILNFLDNYDKLENVDKNRPELLGFAKGSILQEEFNFFVSCAMKAKINFEDALLLGMTYLMDVAGSSLVFYEASSINKPLRRIQARLDRTELPAGKFLNQITITKCN